MKGLASVMLPLAVVTLTGATTAHVRLLRSDPADHASVRAAPHTISLWFSEQVQLSVTSVHLSGPGGPVGLSAPRLGEGPHAPIVCDVRGQLAMGAQQISWRTMSRDGHAASGTISFTVTIVSPAAAHQHASELRR